MYGDLDDHIEAGEGLVIQQQHLGELEAPLECVREEHVVLQVSTTRCRRLPIFA
ncbi:MAG: hypothetical protein R2811_09670 [Flavobacteriales bacterium]